MNQTTKSATILRRALTANAVFSGMCGVLCVLASASIAQVMGIAQAEIFALGVNLEAFSALLIVLATRKDFSRGWVRALVMAVIAMDVLWVVGSAALLLLPAVPLTTVGRWTVFVVAMVVADVAFFQLRGVLGLRRAAAEFHQDFSDPSDQPRRERVAGLRATQVDPVVALHGE